VASRRRLRTARLEPRGPRPAAWACARSSLSVPEALDHPRVDAGGAAGRGTLPRTCAPSSSARTGSPPQQQR